MNIGKKIQENQKQRDTQFKNFASLAGLSAETMDEVIKSRFQRPWEQLKASQKRGRLLSEQFLRCYNKNPYGEDEPQLVAWRSLFMPTEIIYAMNMVPFTAEMAAAHLAMSDIAQGRLEIAEGYEFSQDICSFIKTIAGAIFEDLFPTPDVILTSSHLCDPAAKFSAYAAEKYNRPEFVLDIPYGLWEYRDNPGKLDYAVDYVAEQLEEMVSFINDETGTRLDENKLADAVEWTNRAAEWLRKGNDLAYYKGVKLGSGSKELDYAANLMQTWGIPEVVDVYKTRYEELETAAREAEQKEETQRKPRVVWAHLKPYYKNQIMSYIEQKVDIVGTQVNYTYWDRLNPDEPFRSIARKTILTPGYCPVIPRTRVFLETMRQGDGVIAFYPKSCRHFHSSAKIEEETLKKAGIPMLTIDGDCIDNRGDDFFVLKTRIDRFIKKMENQMRK